jgi:hypothetical protein
MRDLIVERICLYLDARDAGRYAPVFELLFKLEAGLPTMAPFTREQKKLFSGWSAEHYDFDKLTDVQLLDVNDLVQRRYATQR